MQDEKGYIFKRALFLKTLESNIFSMLNNVVQNSFL